MGKISVLRLADVGSADPCRLLYDLFDMLLRPLLYRLELAIHPLQPIACNLLALAQVLGIAIRRNISSMVRSHGKHDIVGTSKSGLVPCSNGRSMDSDYSSSNRYENNAQQAHVT